MTYSCSESTRSFSAAVRAGASCDDTLDCTAGDACTSAGACAGAATAACSAPPSTCGATAALGAVVNLATARVQGAVTLGGAALATTLSYAQVPGYTNSSVYLVAKDTGARHLIASPSYTGGGGLYTLVAGTDRVDASVPPGTYDLLYAHNVTSVGAVGRYPAHALPSGYRLLRACVTVP